MELTLSLWEMLFCLPLFEDFALITDTHAGIYLLQNRGLVVLKCSLPFDLPRAKITYKYTMDVRR